MFFSFARFAHFFKNQEVTNTDIKDIYLIALFVTILMGANTLVLFYLERKEHPEEKTWVVLATIGSLLVIISLLLIALCDLVLNIRSVT